MDTLNTALSIIASVVAIISTVKAVAATRLANENKTLILSLESRVLNLSNSLNNFTVQSEQEINQIKSQIGKYEQTVGGVRSIEMNHTQSNGNAGHGYNFGFSQKSDE